MNIYEYVLFNFIKNFIIYISSHIHINAIYIEVKYSQINYKWLHILKKLCF
jgi:hypothetical protein